MARPKTILQPKVGRTFLPDEHVRAHELCFLLHDFMLELLRSAEQHGLFSERFDFRDEMDRLAFEQADNVFQWFDSTNRVNERAAFLRRTVFPGLLSDFLHFLYVALEASRRGNLTVAFALLRKPIQENLFLFEVIAADLSRFASEFAANPLLLRSQKAGGVQAHTARISAVVNHLADDRFDAQYLCQLRYDKNAEDGFDGVCNKAVHLVTEHAAIRTDSLNLNFIFSGWDAKLTQWAYFYSRLPYLLAYAQLLVEHVFGAMHRSDGPYMGYMQRRLAAGEVLWDLSVTEHYRAAPLDRFALATRARLDEHCTAAGYRTPSSEDLLLMQQDGRWPGESAAAARLRSVSLGLSARLSRALRRFSQ